MQSPLGDSLTRHVLQPSTSTTRQAGALNIFFGLMSVALVGECCDDGVLRDDEYPVELHFVADEAEFGWCGAALWEPYFKNAADFCHVVGDLFGL